MKHDATLTGSLQPGDGLDPRYESRPTPFSRSKLDRKASQLCGQVRRALDFIVPEVLVNSSYDAIVLDVQPAPNTGHFLVLLSSVVALEEDERRKLESEIANQMGQIRLAVTQSICRRKAPTFTFRVVPS